MLALWLMTALGQSLHFDRTPLASGLPRLADFLRGIRHVGFVPTLPQAKAHGIRNKLNEVTFESCIADGKKATAVLFYMACTLRLHKIALIRVLSVACPT
jgi:hypothetical protein